jgi:secondary thiamine-phosphate synthase enzyme
MREFIISTSAREEIVDITAQVRELVAEEGGGGVSMVFVPHCTCALYLNENESGLVQDTQELLAGLADQKSWRHDRIDDNAGAHLVCSLLGASVLVPVAAGKLQLGTWQRIMLVERDGPRSRRRVQVWLLAEREE